MSTTITRLYSTDSDAAAAVSNLKKVGFLDEMITHISGVGNVGALEAAIERAGVPASHARVYAGQVAQGASLVTVDAPVFTSGRAAQILERYSPIDTGIAEPDVFQQAEIAVIPRHLSDPPTTKLLDSDSYFSRLFGLPLLTNSDKQPTGLLTDSKPFSTLSHGTTSSKLGIPTITRS